MKRSKLRFAACLLLAAVVLTAFAALAGGAGTQGDPLVTLSYLSDTFTKQVLDKVDKTLDSRDAAIREEVDRRAAQAEQAIKGTPGGETAGAAPVYGAVTLSAGQVLRGSDGCEVILRSGSAVCAAAAGGALGLVDTTTGGALGGGSALEANHLYLMTEGQSVAASGGATLLVRGSYTIE